MEGSKISPLAQIAGEREREIERGAHWNSLSGSVVEIHFALGRRQRAKYQIMHAEDAAQMEEARLA